MKRLYIIILLVVICQMHGCENYLDRNPLDYTTVDNFFQTETDIKQFVDGLYSGMVPDMYTTYFEFCSDLNALNGARGDLTNTDLALGTYNSNSTSIAYYWNYSHMRNAYVFFEKIENIPMSEASKKLYIGSVSYLLAYRYFMLLRAYENAPIVRKILEVNEADLASSPKEEVFE